MNSRSAGRTIRIRRTHAGISLVGSSRRLAGMLPLGTIASSRRSPPIARSSQGRGSDIAREDRERNRRGRRGSPGAVAKKSDSPRHGGRRLLHTRPNGFGCWGALSPIFRPLRNTGSVTPTCNLSPTHRSTIGNAPSSTRAGRRRFAGKRRVALEETSFDHDRVQSPWARRCRQIPGGTIRGGRLRRHGILSQHLQLSR
jgi:hypothetical protein